MKDLTNPTWIKLKGLLFLLTGLAAALLLIMEDHRWQTVVLLAISIWCFCRFYYFAFYVLQQYVDPAYRFSGLWSFLAYWWTRRKRRGP